MLLIDCCFEVLAPSHSLKKPHQADFPGLTHKHTNTRKPTPTHAHPDPGVEIAVIHFYRTALDGKLHKCNLGKNPFTVPGIKSSS